ncbi:hypothetical protein BGX26_005882 [Mortierella sp. AD094]|nr:hypothetical protein BGX26_005882 [Mortierella sp. AD094]
MRERFQRFKSNYQKVRLESKRTGFGVTNDDKKNDIFTIEQKLEGKCPCYARMDALFGKRPSITPLDHYNDMPLEPQDLNDETQEEVGLAERPREETHDINHIQADTFFEPEDYDDEYNNHYGDNDDFNSTIATAAATTTITNSSNNKENEEQPEVDAEDGLDSDQISNLSLTSPNLPAHKRKLSDALSPPTSKRSRSKDPRKAPLRAETGISQGPLSPRSSILSRYDEAKIAKSTCMYTPI